MQVRLVVSQWFPSLGIHHLTPCSSCYGVACGGVPFHRWGKTRINIGTPFGNKADFQAAATAHEPDVFVFLAHLLNECLCLRTEMRTACHNAESAVLPSA